MDLGPHANFILISYFAAAVIVTLLVIWVAADYRAQLRAIKALEAKGASRRSGASLK